jgi:ABC-type antimicrobial peptide transport system permease subunit
MGIRMALGATMAQAMRTVAMPGVVLSLIGVVVGLAVAFGTARLVRSLIWGVTVTDPLTFAAVAALLIGVAMTASVTRPCACCAWIPRRLSGMNNMGSDGGSNGGQTSVLHDGSDGGSN